MTVQRPNALVLAVDALRATGRKLGSVPRPWMDERPAENAYTADLPMGMILTGHEVHAVEIEGGWLEIDTREDYELVTSMMASGEIVRFFDPGATFKDSFETTKTQWARVT